VCNQCLDESSKERLLIIIHDVSYELVEISHLKVRDIESTNIARVMTVSHVYDDLIIMRGSTMLHEFVSIPRDDSMHF
jgi:hypothetical protein